MKQVVAIRHVHFEDLGAFEPALRDAGFAVRYCDIGSEAIPDTAADAALLVVLGAPIGAYEEDKYPFVSDELRLLETRLASGRPTLGICLGAQLIARALGAAVYPGNVREIGWGPITLTEAGRQSPVKHLERANVLHWHGDTFDLPASAELLASTAVTLNQAFAFGAAALALQFHLEVEASGFEQWLIGHTHEIASVPGLSVQDLRRDCLTLAQQTAACGIQVLQDWLAGLPSRQ
jgi:GMP synthase (glutamine-hydrolysing)